MQQIFFWTLSQIRVLTESCLCTLQAVMHSFDLRAWVFYLFVIFIFSYFSCRPFEEGCVPFQIILIQLNLPQVNFFWSVVTYKRYECSWAKFQVYQKRVWILMQCNCFCFFFFYKVVTMYFLLCYCGVCGKKSNLKQYKAATQQKQEKKWRGILSQGTVYMSLMWPVQLTKFNKVTNLHFSSLLFSFFWVS